MRSAAGCKRMYVLAMADSGSANQEELTGGGRKQVDVARNYTSHFTTLRSGTTAFTLTLLLIQACASGDVVLVANLVSEQNADPFSKDESGRTPLGVACEAGHVQVAKYLIETKGVSPGFRGTNGSTPLHAAARGGHLDVVRYLVDDRGVDPSSRDREGLSPLDYATNNVVREFLIRCNVLGTKGKSFLPVDASVSLTPTNTPVSSQSLMALPFVGAPLTELLISGVSNNPTSNALTHTKPCPDGYKALLNASLNGDRTRLKKLVEDRHVDPQSCRDENNATPLHHAASQGHLGIIKYLVNNCDPKCKDNEKNTPLHLAISGGHFSVLQYLIEDMGCDPMGKGEKGMTALHFACKAGYSHIVEYLVEERKLSVSSPDGNGATPLHIAAQFSSLRIVKYLVEKHNSEVDCKNNYGLTPLHYAAAKGRLDTVQYLINERGCDPMCRGWLGVTPLHAACEAGSLDVVKWLVNNGNVDCMCQCEDGSTPLHAAAQFGTLDLVQYLVEEQNCNYMCKNKPGNTPLMHAAAGNKVEILKYLIDEKGCDPMDRGMNGLTPFHCASITGALPVVKYLIEDKKLDPLCLDENGVTPLHAAAQFGTVPLVKYLSGHPSYMTDFKANFGNILLLQALQGGKPDIVKYLVSEKGCDPLCRAPNGSSTIHLACELDRLDMVRYLVSEGKLDASCRDGDGSSPLHTAAQFGTLETVRFLVEEKGLTIDDRNTLGNTALHCAVLGANLQNLQYFLHHKDCDPTSRGQNDGTLLHCACMTGDVVMVKYLLDNPKIDPLCPDGIGASALHTAAHHGHISVLKLMIEKYLCDPGIKNQEGLTPKDVAETRGHAHVASYLSSIEDTASTDVTKIIETELNTYIKRVTPTGVELGRGTFGSVIELSSDGEILAGKSFKAFSNVKQLSLVAQLCGELNMMMQLYHKNIVRCKGVGLLVDEPLPLLLMERMMTSLHAYLLQPDNSDLPLKRKVSILFDTASGLEYLHHRTPSIIHRDLTATNVLLDTQLTAKIADFGNSRIMDLATPDTLIPDTPEYMPPEVQGKDYDPSLDMFSFGHLSLFTVIQSIVHPLLPSKYTDSRGKVRMTTEAKRREQFVEKANQILPKDHPLIEMIKECLQNRPALRPRSRELVTLLKDMLVALEEANGTDDLNLFNAISAVEPVSYRCRQIGLALGLESSKLEVIEKENMKVLDRLTEVLKLWLRKEYDVKKFGEPSWSLLAEAVRHRAGGNDSALAQEITKKHAGSRSF